MTDTTASRAIALLESYGFAIIDTYDKDDNTYREMADSLGRRILVRSVEGIEMLSSAIPRGEWVRDIERRFPYWPDQPYVTTAEALELLLSKVLSTPGARCDGRCTGISHRDACPEYVMPR